MKVDYQNNKKTMFCDLNPGDVFTVTGITGPLMVLSHIAAINRNCVTLTYGVVHHVADEDLVFIHSDSELLVK
jgi:hypothetical protein